MIKVKNTGKEFETLSHKVFTLLSHKDSYTSVELDVQLDSPDGKRQFDVITRSKVSGLDILTVIECRDYKKNLSVEHIDGLYSKMIDVNANKAVLVAKKGFSKTAKQKAKRLGITLCTIHDFKRGLENIGLEIPLTFIKINEINFNNSFKAYLNAGTELKVKTEIYINDQPLMKIFKKEYNAGQINSSKLNEFARWRPKLLEEDDSYIIDANGNKINTNDFEIHYELKGSYYFGYLHDLPNAIGINNLTQEETNIFFKTDDILIDHKENLISYSKYEDIPKVKSLSLVIISDIDFKYTNRKLALKSVDYLGD